MKHIERPQELLELQDFQARMITISYASSYSKHILKLAESRSGYLWFAWTRCMKNIDSVCTEKVKKVMCQFSWPQRNRLNEPNS